MAILSSGIEILDVEACRALLRQSTIGRIASSRGALPIVIPVSYAMVDDSILLRSDEGASLAGARQQTVVAFEIDDYDTHSHSGWSVLVQGVLRVVSAPGEVDRASRMALAPWAPEAEGALLSISCDVITGRRITG